VETTQERTYWRPKAEDNPLNAWSHRAELQAKTPVTNLLQGRGIALKDNVCVAGLPTTLGTFAELLSKDGKYPISAIDATVVRRLLEAGATVKGTAVCENYSACPLSYSAPTGPIHQPWCKGYCGGGSSSGCSILVAAAGLAKGTGNHGEVVDLAIGGDQGGSIRLPAAFAGCYGLKPTHGLVPYTGIAALAPMMDHVGPMATTVLDIARVLQVIAGYDGLDARMTAEAPLRNQVKDYPKLVNDFLELPEAERKSKPLRIGLLQEGFTTYGMTESVRDTVKAAATKFFSAAGAEVIDVSVPMHKLGAHVWTASTRASLSDFGFLGQMPGYLTFAPPHLQPRRPLDQEWYELLTATNPSAVNVAIAGSHLKKNFGPHPEAKAHRQVFKLRAAYDDALESVDILVTPTTSTVAMPHPKLKFIDGDPASSVMDKLKMSIGSSTNTCPFNVTGHPAISVPCGFAAPEDKSTDVKFPIGMQLIARRWDEETLLKAAALFEREILGSGELLGSADQKQ
jgi:amidase